MIKTTLRIMKVVTAGGGGSDGDDDEDGDGYNVDDKGCAGVVDNGISGLRDDDESSLLYLTKTAKQLEIHWLY